MTSRLKILIDLLHAPGDIALATHSVTLSGYPFATSVAFATDEHHRPLMLISRLAEHTKNLIADSRASLLVAQDLGDGEIARATLIGNIVEVELPPLMLARYLRFHSEADRFLQLADFRFFRIDPMRIRVVGGFAQAGWLDGRQLLDAPCISLEEEVRLIKDAQPKVLPGVRLLGVDSYGMDCRIDAVRKRVNFKSGPVLFDAASAALARAIRSL